jgi:hypothetical protein
VRWKNRLLPMLCIVPCLTSAASAQQSTEQEFREQYDRYEEAVRHMNARVYMAFFSDDFSMTSPDGTVHDHAEMTKYQEVNAKTTRKVNAYSATIEAITPSSDGAVVVIVLQKYDRDQAPLEQPDKPHNINTAAVQREIWRRDVHGSWQIRRTEEILVGPVYFDGKVMNR